MCSQMCPWQNCRVRGAWRRVELEAGSPLGCAHGAEPPPRGMEEGVIGSQKPAGLWPGDWAPREAGKWGAEWGQEEELSGLPDWAGCHRRGQSCWPVRLAWVGTGWDLASAQRWYFIEFRGTRPVLTTSCELFHLQSSPLKTMWFLFASCGSVSSGPGRPLSRRWYS